MSVYNLKHLNQDLDECLSNWQTLLSMVQEVVGIFFKSERFKLRQFLYLVWKGTKILSVHLLMCRNFMNYNRLVYGNAQSVLHDPSVLLKQLEKWLWYATSERKSRTGEVTQTAFNLSLSALCTFQSKAGNHVLKCPSWKNGEIIPFLKAEFRTRTYIYPPNLCSPLQAFINRHAQLH